MKALFVSGNQSGLELVEVPEPAVHTGEVKIRVLTTGICGTDLHIAAWDAWAQSAVAAPLIPGHEFFGEVVEVGPDVRDVRVGDRVSGEGHVVCGTCRNCRAGRRHMCIRTQSVGVQRDGAFAEYVVIPESNVWVHHNGIDPVLGAVFDPLGNAVHTALQFPILGEDVLITGAGPIGIMAAAVARHAGARLVAITDVSESRLKLAMGVRADIAVNVTTSTIKDAQKTLGMKEGFDIGLEMSGNAAAMQQMILNMNHGGRIALLGLPTEAFEIDWASVVTRMLTLQGVYGRQMYETWYAMSAMLQTSEWLRTAISSVITDVLPAHRWRDGFEIARSSSTGKVVLDWTEL